MRTHTQNTRLIEEVLDFLDPVVGYSWTSDLDRTNVEPLLKRLVQALVVPEVAAMVTDAGRPERPAVGHNRSK